MLGLLIVLFGCLAGAAALSLPGERRRDAAVIGMAGAALWAALGAEALSVFHALRFAPVALWWGLGCGALGWAAVRRRGLIAPKLRLPGGRDRVVWLLAGLTGIVLAAALLGAALGAPNTWDTWTYHLPRQFHWIQNGSVAHYAADDRRQLEMPPLAEYIGVQWMILSGSDGWANMPQWFALLGCALASSAAAREMHAGPRAQALAALLVVTIPAAAMQAMNAKNDVVTAFFALSLMLLGLRLCRAAHPPWREAVLFGACLGLLLLTKGTGYLLAAPVCAVVGVSLLRRAPRRAVPLGAAIAAIALALNTPHWSRNLRSFGHPLSLPASRGGYDLANTSHTPGAVASNLIRNIALHAVVPDEEFNRREERAVGRALRAIGQDAGDPATTFAPDKFPFALGWSGRQDGQAPAPGHVLIGVALVGAALLARRAVREGPGWGWLLVPFGAFLLFCIYLKWQLWHVRLHIPFLALLCPVGAAVLARGRMWAVIGPAALLSLTVTAYALLLGDTRRFLPPGSILTESRSRSFFQNAPFMEQAFERLEAEVRPLAPRAVGVDLLRCNYEYPLLRMIRSLGARAVNTGDPAADAGAPDLLITSRADDIRRQRSAAERFRPVLVVGPFTLALPPDRAAAWLRARPFAGWSTPPVEPTADHWTQHARSAQLRFDSRGRPTVLALSAQGEPGQFAVIHLNGLRYKRIDLGPGGSGSAEIDLRPRSGPNTLTISRSPSKTPLVWTLLQLRPDEVSAAPVPGGNPEPH